MAFGVLLINSAKLKRGRAGGHAGGAANEMQTESKLVFNRYDNQYFLSQVWTVGSIRGGSS